ncbi:MAG: GGDEF domain-containing protein [Sediminibacterium sp.]
MKNTSKVAGSRSVRFQAPLKPSTAQPVAIAHALARSELVQVAVETCADDLAAANSAFKRTMAGGSLVEAAHTSLAITERVESKVRESSDELLEVNESLAKGIADLKITETALTRSREALAETEANLATARMRALHDPATTLPTRELFDNRLTHAISLADRHGWTLAVMFLDLDGFKTINDTHGHSAGDGVLKEVANRLLEHSREEDTVCRNGGDEFLYLLVNPQGTKNIRRIADHVLMTIARPIAVDGLQLVIKASIGIAVYPDDGTSPQQLVKNADTAMYGAKSNNGGGLVFFARTV